MADSEKDQKARKPTETAPEKTDGRRGAANEKLRKKLEKLKKKDPNIYPVF